VICLSLTNRDKKPREIKGMDFENRFICVSGFKDKTVRQLTRVAYIYNILILELFSSSAKNTESLMYRKVRVGNC